MEIDWLVGYNREVFFDGGIGDATDKLDARKVRRKADLGSKVVYFQRDRIAGIGDGDALGRID